MAIGTVWGPNTWGPNTWANDTWGDAAGPPACVAPTNIAFASATNIPSFPATISQDVRCAPTTYTVYYEFTAPATGLIHIFAFSGTVASDYQPQLSAYLGPAGGPTQLVFGADNRPIQLQVVSGQQYFLEINTNAGDPTPANLALTAQYLVQSPIAVGDLIVNDDTEGFPVIILSPTTDNTVRASIAGIVAGEAGDALDSNIMAFSDEWNGLLVTYSPTFTIINAIDVNALGIPFIRAMNGTKFYVGFDAAAGDVTVRDLLATGFFGAVNITLTGNTSIKGIAPNNDETILYFANVTSGAAIKRWDLIGNVAMADFVAGTASHLVVDILVLEDDSIVFNLVTLAGAGFIRRYNAAGTLLTEIPFTTELPAFTLPRLAFSSDRATFWQMTHGLGVGIYTNYAVDGTVIVEVEHPEYETGAYTGAETATPPLFGASFSCPLVVARGSSAPEPEPEPEPGPVEATECPGGGMMLPEGTPAGPGCPARC